MSDKVKKKLMKDQPSALNFTDPVELPRELPTVTISEVRAAQGLPPLEAPAPVPVPDTMSLEAYLSFKNVPEVRRAGMRAFTKLQRAALSEWEAVFANY